MAHVTKGCLHKGEGGVHRYLGVSYSGDTPRFHSLCNGPTNLLQFLNFEILSFILKNRLQTARLFPPRWQRVRIQWSRHRHPRASDPDRPRRPGLGGMVHVGRSG